MPYDRDEMLRRVYRRAGRLWWWQRTAVIGAIALALGCAAAIPTVLLDRDNTVQVAAQGDGATSTTIEPATTTELPTTTLPPTTTTTRDPCRATHPPSNDDGADEPPQSCGPLRWDPAPSPNQPMSMSVTVSPASPRVGEPVTFHVEATDPDSAPVISGCPEPDPNYGDGTRQQPCGCLTVLYERYGKWPPPPRQRGTFVRDFTHTYADAGTFEFQIPLGTVNHCADTKFNPYISGGVAKATVTVAPA